MTGKWSEAVFIINSNNTYSSTEMDYLENRFYNLAKEANRYKVNNKRVPSAGNASVEKKSELSEFVKYAMLVIKLMGINVFESQNDPQENPIPTIKSKQIQMPSKVERPVKVKKISFN